METRIRVVNRPRLGTIYIPEYAKWLFFWKPVAKHKGFMNLEGYAHIVTNYGFEDMITARKVLYDFKTYKRYTK